MARKVVFKIAGDAYKVAQNIWKIISGSAHVKRIPSNSAAAKNAKNLSSTSAAQIKINNARLQKGLKQQADVKTAEKLKRAGEEIKLKPHPSLKNGKPKPKPKTKTKPVNGRRNKKVDKAKSEVKPVTTSRVTRKGVVTETKIPKGTKKGGFIINPRTGKPFTKKAWLLAGGGAATWGTYVASQSGRKKPNGEATTSSGAATTTKPPKPSRPVTTAPAPPSVLSAQATAAATKPKPQQSGPSDGPPQRSAIKAKPKSYEQKLKEAWIKGRGGIKAFKPTTKWGKFWHPGMSEQEVADSAWTTEVFSMRDDQGYSGEQKHEKIIAERKELSEKKRGGQVKKKKAAKKRPRGVGKALRGYGKATYSSKMY